MTKINPTGSPQRGRRMYKELSELEARYTGRGN